MDNKQVQEFLSRFTAWARMRPDALAAALVGSHARESARADSDLDLVLVTGDPQAYIVDPSWTLTFGEVERHEHEDYGRLRSLRVWYRNGLEAEYGITGPDWAAMPLDAGTRKVISAGMVVLFERGDILSRHQAT